jgi:hypothetical protein
MVHSVWSFDGHRNVDAAASRPACWRRRAGFRDFPHTKWAEIRIVP